ncbi:hypothetical protein CR513_12142, partial [Mucuna pruriens]
MIARVLIGNGSSINVMLKTTMDKLYSLGTILRNSPVVVRAFDGSKREVIGEITLPTRIGPTTFDITFQVMDIRPTYNCLLARPWIHAVGAVPSSLHQKVKFIADGQLISVMGEKEMMVSTPLPTIYIEGDEEALETSFQALEIVGTTSVEPERGDLKPSKAAIMAVKVLITNGFEPGKGLGRRLDGIAKLVEIQKNPGRAGLGYSWATKKGKPGWKVQGEQQIRPNLYRYFTSGGVVTPEHIATVEDQLVEMAAWINNATLMLDDTGKSNRQDEEEETEEEALKELERLLEQERPKLQFGAEELEVINHGEGEETREIRIGKLIPPDLKQGLIKLLREYEDIFAWSYRDMSGLDTAIVEHRLPLIPNATPVRQQLRRMKPEVALKIKEIEK